MKTRCLLLLCLFLAFTGGAAQSAPESTPEPSLAPLLPILEIFEPKIKGEQMNQMGFDSQHPLLQIRSVREVHLARDNKGVLLVLEDKDAKTFAALTREFDGRPLIFKSGDVAKPITTNGVVENGKIGFKYPEAEALAEQLRRGFNLGEFENTNHAP